MSIGYKEYEIHASETSGFVPSAATLKASGRQRVVTMSDLEPGKTYYVRRVTKLVHPQGFVTRGVPSPEISIVAGFLEPRHLNPETVLGPIPPNGSFEGRLDGDSPPSHWAMVTGEWKTDVDWASGDQKDGALAVELLATAVAAKLRSSFFPVLAGEGYTLKAWLKKVGTPEYDVDLDVEWVTAAKGAISTDTLAVALATLGGGWEEQTNAVSAPSTAAFARVAVRKATADAFACRFDAISLART